MAEPWTQFRLREFFGDLPVTQWFNQNAPSVKSGAVNPQTLTADEAILLMLQEPLLIRRPLFELGSQRWCGFDWQQLQHYLNLTELQEPPQVSETCSHPGEKGSCP